MRSSQRGQQLEATEESGEKHLTVKGAGGGRISKAVVEGADELMKESVLEVTGVAGGTGVESVKLLREKSRASL